MVGEQTQEGICKAAARAPAGFSLLVLRLRSFCFLVPGAAWLKMLPGSWQSQVRCAGMRLEAVFHVGKELILSARCSTVGVGNGIVDSLLSHDEPGVLIESLSGPREDTQAITNRNTRL